MKLPFGRIPQPPIALSARGGAGKSIWWGAALVAIGVAVIVLAMFVSHAAIPPFSEPELVEAVTHAAVQQGADGNLLTRVAQPASKCPT